MISSLMGQTCRIFRAGTASDRYGDPVPAYPATPTATHPCRLQQVAGSEDLAGRDLPLTVWRLYLPALAELDEHDQVEVDGRRYQVAAVYPVQHPAGGVHHLQVELRSYAGTVPSTAEGS